MQMTSFLAHCGSLQIAHRRCGWPWNVVLVSGRNRLVAAHLITRQVLQYILHRLATETRRQWVGWTSAFVHVQSGREMMTACRGLMVATSAILWRLVAHNFSHEAGVKPSEGDVRPSAVVPIVDILWWGLVAIVVFRLLLAGKDPRRRMAVGDGTRNLVRAANHVHILLTNLVGV